MFCWSNASNPKQQQGIGMVNLIWPWSRQVLVNLILGKEKPHVYKEIKRFNCYARKIQVMSNFSKLISVISFIRYALKCLKKNSGDINISL